MGRECNKIKKTMKKVDNSMVDINMEKRRRVFKKEKVRVVLIVEGSINQVWNRIVNYVKNTTREMGRESSSSS